MGCPFADGAVGTVVVSPSGTDDPVSIRLMSRCATWGSCRPQAAACLYLACASAIACSCLALPN